MPLDTSDSVGFFLPCLVQASYLLGSYGENSVAAGSGARMVYSILMFTSNAAIIELLLGQRVYIRFSCLCVF